MNIGVRRTETGSICVTKKLKVVIFLPIKRYLPRPYDAGTERTTEISMQLMEIRKLFPKE
jgi:hypothetical protein